MKRTELINYLKKSDKWTPVEMVTSSFYNGDVFIDLYPKYFHCYTVKCKQYSEIKWDYDKCELTDNELFHYIECQGEQVYWRVEL